MPSWPPKPHPCVLDLTHPLVSGLILASALEEGSGLETLELVQDRLTGTSPASFGSSNPTYQEWLTNPYGWGMKFEPGSTASIVYGSANIYAAADQAEGTVEFIFKRRSTMASSDQATVVSIEGGSGRFITLHVDPRASFEFAWGRYTGDSGVNRITFPAVGGGDPDRFLSDSWNQVVGVKTASTMRLYLNNVEIVANGSPDPDAKTQSWLNGSGNIILFGDHLEIAGWRWWDRALTEAERDDLYADPFAMYRARITCGNPIARMFGGTAAESIAVTYPLTMDPVADVPARVLQFGIDLTGVLAGLGGPFVPESRLINTTAPLTGGGNLSADRTLAIADFIASGASHARGAVPDPGSSAGSAKFLREDATWNVPSGTGSYTDEEAQDAVGTILADTATVNFTYTDATPEIKADVLPGGIKLDDLGAPDDNTDLNASTSAHGLQAKFPGGTTTFLRADGNFASVGGSGGSGATAQDFIAAAWDKKFFSDLGVLPANERIVASLVTFPTETGTQGSPTWTKNHGWGNLVAGAVGLVYWDLGALRSNILTVLTCARFSSQQLHIHYSSAAPSDASPDGFMFGFSTANNFQLFKHASAAYTQLGSDVTNIAVATVPMGIAFYYVDSTDTLTGFTRIGGRWLEVMTTTNTSFTTFRYVSLRATGTMPLILPLTVWSD
jgi:hypothetical protein